MIVIILPFLYTPAKLSEAATPVLHVSTRTLDVPLDVVTLRSLVFPLR